MATYKVVDADQLDADMTGLADTIRTKGRTSADLAWPEGYKAAVNDIETGVALPTLSDPGTAEDLRAGKQLIDQEGNVVTGTALVAGGGGVKPDGAFAPVRSFTAGKQYVLLAVIDGVRRFINNTAYNDWTLNATQIGIAEDAGDYVIFDATPVLFTAVASGNGFLLQNGSSYLYGMFDGGTNLKVGETQMVWSVDTSATAGIPDGKFYPKEDENAVWLTGTMEDRDSYIKFESANSSFGFDYVGRDDTYSTGFVSFVLYENVAGEGELNPVMDTTTENPAGSGDILKGKEAFVNGKKVVGDLNPGANVAGVTATPDKVVAPYVFVDKDGVERTGTLVTQTFYRGASEPSADLGNDYDLFFVMG